MQYIQEIEQAIASAQAQAVKQAQDKSTARAIAQAGRKASGFYTILPRATVKGYNNNITGAQSIPRESIKAGAVFLPASKPGYKFKFIDKNAKKSKRLRACVTMIDIKF